MRGFREGILLENQVPAGDTYLAGTIGDSGQHTPDALGGRFSRRIHGYAKAVLDALREELRKRNYLPILFDFNVSAARIVAIPHSHVAVQVQKGGAVGWRRVMHRGQIKGNERIA